MKLILLADKDVVESQFSETFLYFCKKNHLTLDKIRKDFIDDKEMQKLLSQQKNICIQYDHTKDISAYKKIANVLFMQNCCLLPQDRFIFDANGYGIHANFVALKLNRRIYQSQDHQRLKDFFNKYNYEFDAKNLQTNSIFIYLDCLQDETNLLDVCCKHLPPSATVTLVAEKHNQSNLQQYFNLYKNKFTNCNVLCDDIDCSTLLGCEAIILRNNNICYKAMAIGIKVITFGFGLYSGTQTILECHHKSWMLKHCLSFIPDKDAIINLFSSLYEYGIDKKTTQYTFNYNNQIINWLSRMFV